MTNVVVGNGKLNGKGVYAARDFRKGEKVMDWNLQKITKSQFRQLRVNEHKFVHSFWGEMFLFPEPARYTNHSVKPNTMPDFKNQCDIASESIKKGESITTNASKELEFELKTWVEAFEKKPASDFVKLKGGYRNAILSYKVEDNLKKVLLQRQNGNWTLIKTI